MRTVRISMRDARALFEFFSGGGFIHEMPHEVAAARANLERAMKPKRSLAPARKRRAEKKQTKRGASEDIRKAVWVRADERCEVCGTHGSGANPLDFERLFRKVNGESVEECWICCRSCHKRKHPATEIRAGALSQASEGVGDG